MQETELSALLQFPHMFSLPITSDMIQISGGLGIHYFGLSEY